MLPSTKRTYWNYVLRKLIEDKNFCKDYPNAWKDLVDIAVCDLPNYSYAPNTNIPVHPNLFIPKRHQNYSEE